MSTTLHPLFHNNREWARRVLAEDPDFFTQAHQVYGRTGLPCVRCGAAIRQLRQGQRSTWYCARCQR